MSFSGETRMLNLSVILDAEEGATLVDAGLPGQEQAILQALRENEIEPAQLKRIILTHHDIDHVGSLAALKELTGAEVLAHEDEAPYIEGAKRAQKTPPPERLEQMPEFKALLESKRACHVDRPLHDGDVLHVAGGIEVVATPGHTVGHTALYLQRTKALIAGDSLTSSDGELNGPMLAATPDMTRAMQSVRKLSGLDIDVIVAYHGGIVHRDVREQLKRIAEQPSSRASPAANHFQST